MCSSPAKAAVVMSPLPASPAVKPRRTCSRNTKGCCIDPLKPLPNSPARTHGPKDVDRQRILPSVTTFARHLGNIEHHHTRPHRAHTNGKAKSEGWRTKRADPIEVVGTARDPRYATFVGPSTEVAVTKRFSDLPSPGSSRGSDDR